MCDDTKSESLTEVAQPPCPFCEIAAERAPATIVDRQPNAVVFEPLNPVTRGHLLVVPSRHLTDFAEDPMATGRLMTFAAQVAQKIGDCNLITSRGKFATQTIFHLHVHLVPRVNGDGLRLPWAPHETRANHPWELQ